MLQECIQRAGSLHAGLKFYVGAANLEDDGGYADKVLAEHARLKLVAAGRVRSPDASRRSLADRARSRRRATPAEDKVALLSVLLSRRAAGPLHLGCTRLAIGAAPSGVRRR